MSIQFRCIHCSMHMEAPDNLSGKKARCPKCSTVIDVPLIVSDKEDAFAAKKADSSIPTPPPFRDSAQPASDFPHIELDDESSSQRQPRYSTAASSVKGTRSQNVTRLILVSTVALYVLFFLAVVAIQLDGKTSQERDFAEMLPALLFGPLLIVAALVFYFAPTLIAYTRDHQNMVPILILNIVFGWTVLGWVGSLAWACSSDIKESRQYVRQVNVQESNDS